MRTVIAAALIAALAGCGSSPEQQCKDAAATSCKKLFECWTTDAERARLMLGASAEECTKSAQIRCEPSAALCPAPRVWDSAQADACINGFAAIGCTELRTGATPASCSSTCK